MLKLPEGEEWRSQLIRQADRLVQNEVALFNLKDLELGSEINWNYEYQASKHTPMRPIAKVDYRDYAETGDCKFVWELSRHPHLVVLARAYAVTGYRPYAETVAKQLESWINQCPFGMGMNWRSPLELAIRLINWVWALELTKPAEVITPELGKKITQVAYRHLWEIQRKYSKFSSANNHLIGEAAGVFIGSSYFASLKSAQRWQAESREILFNEIFAQTYPDGGNREQAMGYHLFALEFFLLAGLAARQQNCDFPAEYWAHLEKMFEFISGFREGGTLPMIGDADDGYVLDLGMKDREVDPLGVGAILFNRADFKAHVPAFPERACWLLGDQAFEKFEKLDARSAPKNIVSRAYPDSGYYLLQYGQTNADDRISVAFDCGELGFGPIAAHGHADALSFTLRVAGKDILVDPGTFDYFTEQRWRSYFRSTRAHNTVVVDDANQSQMLGPFMWGRRAQARCTKWEPTPNGGMVTGEHDGFSHMPGSVIHRRTLSLIGPRREILVRDQLTGEGEHKASLFLHFSEHCMLRKASAHCFSAECGEELINIEFDSRFEVESLEGSYEPIYGWVSRGYHRKSPATTIVAKCDWHDSLETEIRILISERRSTRPWQSAARPAKVTAG